MSDPEIKNPTREEWFWLFEKINEHAKQLNLECVEHGFGPKSLGAEHVIRVFALCVTQRSPEMAYHAALQAAVDLAKQSHHSVQEQDGDTCFARCGADIRHVEVELVSPNPEQVS